ncbi:unnamed protein product [Adineta steineri]|uniref:Chitin-binding type-2 domain-containing protein n=1 Tax=Adineta steineri TaxID=433720 RepID=A0A815Z9J2_9BILA|nr:unnamed protein product [Adineta steineri]
MYILLIVTCFLLTFQVNARKIYIYERDASYNPCVSGSGVYFYPDPTNPHRYYQCDASGKFYLQTCASDLVWDDLITACNYASAVAPSSGGASSGSSSSGGGSPSPPDDSSETPSSGASSGSSSSGGGSQSPPDDSSETPSSGASSGSSSGGGSHSSSSGNLGPTQISFPSSPTDKVPATIQKPSSSASSSSASSSSVSSSSPSSSSSSLCKPVNPCGDHGECIESPSNSNKRRRFACICEENWFGRLCDKQSSGFSTPGPRTHLDQIINNTLTTDTFSLPISNEKDSKYIFYGLNGNNKVEPMSHLNKRMIEPESDEEFE